MYRTIPSLREYVLVSQDRAHVDRFSLNEQGQWVFDDATGLDAVVELSTVGCRLPLADIYAKVEFPPEADAPTEK
jgi:Uma2 family endonuclease